jgi:hypothetical protein
MNNKHQEKGTLSGPLIFTLPASSFVAILRLDWLERTNRTAVLAKTHGWRLLNAFGLVRRLELDQHS